MLGSTWHTDDSLLNLRYDTRIDAFALALLEISEHYERHPAWVPYEDIFNSWRQCHINILIECYGQDTEMAEAKTDAWLRILQDVGQGLREFFTDYIDDFPTDFIRRKGTKTCFLVDWKTVIQAHATIYGGRLRMETQNLFLHNPEWKKVYQDYGLRRQ